MVVNRHTQRPHRTSVTFRQHLFGRGAQYFLRNRQDVFHVFLYASRDHKIGRLIARGATQDKAIEQVDTTGKARAAFVRQYLGLKWPEPHLFPAMFNTRWGNLVRPPCSSNVSNSSSLAAR